MKGSFFVRVLVVVAAVGLLASLAGACGGGDSDDGIKIKGTETANGSDDKKDDDGKDGGDSSAGSTELTITMQDNFFEPKDVTVPVNKTVKITLPNKGSAIHNMHILSKPTEGKDFTGKTTVNGGETDRMEVKFTKKGVVKFQCDYHVPDMVGTITVK
ncbi:MAG: cupredoxin domain-containing protein [Thermoflexaceae bacterium]|nr:cupredoxin domain-containing protein [Thermoflexaceae bacterium]